MTIVARADFEPNTIAELLDYVRANKENVTYAHAGVGSASHLCGMLFMDAIDVPMTTVPYKGTGPAMTDLLGGQVDMMCDQTTNTVTQIKSGKIKGYAVTTKERLPVLPDLPTLDESGLDGFEMTVWHGLYAPAGTPQEILDKLSAALQVALQDPKVIERFAAARHGAGAARPGNAGCARRAPQGRGRQVEADHRGRRRLRGLSASRVAPRAGNTSKATGSPPRDVRCGRRGGAPRPDRAAAPAGATQRAHHRPRRRQGLGRDGQGGRGPLAGAARGARGHPLRPCRALRADRDRRGGAPGAGCRRAGRGGTDPGARRRRPARTIWSCA